MGFRTGLIGGLAIGYVLGTKAGRERYDQLRSAADAFLSSETARHLEDGLRQAWGSAQDEFGDQLGAVRDIRDRLESGATGTD